MISDIFGKSGRDMLDALIAGQRDPHVLAELARGSMRGKKSVLQEALTGHFRDHHGYLLKMMCDRIDALTAQIEALTGRIDEAIAPFAHQVAQLDEIPGVGKTGAQELIAEIGTDMARFPTAGHLVSWAKYAPQARQSAGKSKPGTTGKGNPWIAGTLGEAGISAARTRTFLGSRYHRLARRRGKQRALVAVGNSILIITYTCCLIPPPASPTPAPTGTTGSPRCGANASSSPNLNGYPARRFCSRRPLPDRPQPHPAPLRSAGCYRLPIGGPIFDSATNPLSGKLGADHGDRPVPPALAPGPGRQHLADHPGLIQPPEQQPWRRQHMRHPAPRRLAPPAAKPAGDRPGRLLLPGRMRLQQHHQPVRAPQPPGRHPAMPAQHPRPALRAHQQPARQLPLDQIPIPGYRQHRLGSPEPSGLRTSSRVHPEGLGVNGRQEKEFHA